MPLVQEPQPTLRVGGGQHEQFERHGGGSFQGLSATR
jgi:hypothetical protein